MPRLANEPTTHFPANVAQQIVTNDKRTTPLWLGPSDKSAMGGVTQSMCQGYLVCRERFRVKYVLGLKPQDVWEKKSGYGNMWHVCEEHHAKNADWQEALTTYTTEQMRQYSAQRPDIGRWSDICRMQFPEYVKYWSRHPNVLDRQPLMQEQVFDVSYTLPSGRTVRLRGKFDSVDLIPSQGGVFQQENKTKGDIDPISLQRQLKFDLQTLLYHVALEHIATTKTDFAWTQPICGVRYNVVRRPFSGGKGSIQQHKEKRTKDKVYKTKPMVPGKYVPAETDAEFFKRLRVDYIEPEPEYWFFRLMCRILPNDVTRFKRQCLEPMLENMLDDFEWWAWCMEKYRDHWDTQTRSKMFPMHAQRHFRFPYGVYNSLTEGGYTDYDDYLDSGIEAGLRRVDTLFTELQ